MSDVYFETIKCEGFEAFHLDFHEKRMAKTIGLNINLGEYIYAPTDELLKCKVIYNSEGIIDIEYTPYTKRVIESFQLIFDDSIEYAQKCLDRRNIDALFEQRQSCDEIIIVKNGLVTDTSIANIAIYDGNNWITPKQPLLQGTTRARLLKEGTIFEKDISIEMLQNASKMALLNAMIDMDVLKDYSLRV